jgi:hypothetical protein
VNQVSPGAPAGRLAESWRVAWPDALLGQTPYDVVKQAPVEFRLAAVELLCLGYARGRVRRERRLCNVRCADQLLSWI